LFAELALFANLASRVRAKSNDQLLHRRGMTPTERVAGSANWKIVVDRVLAAEAMWPNVIDLPRFACRPAAQVAQPTSLSENR
jgi:hypothetical protein